VVKHLAPNSLITKQEFAFADEELKDKPFSYNTEYITQKNATMLLNRGDSRSAQGRILITEGKDRNEELYYWNVQASYYNITFTSLERVTPDGSDNRKLKTFIK